MLKQTSNQRKVEDGDSFEPPVLMEERKPRAVRHINNNIWDTAAGQSASDSQKFGSTDEVTLENVSQGTTPQGAAYADVQSVLKAKKRMKGTDKSSLQSNPEKIPTTKEEGIENAHYGTSESEYQLAREITKTSFHTEMVENPYYDSSG